MRDVSEGVSQEKITCNMGLDGRRHRRSWSVFALSACCLSSWWEQFTVALFLHRPHLRALLYAGEPLNMKLQAFPPCVDWNGRADGVDMEQL